MLKTRIITAAILITLLNLLLFKSTPLTWSLTFVLLSAFMAWEWSSFGKLNKTSYKLIYALIVLDTTMGVFILNLEYYLLLLSTLLLALMIISVTCYQKTKGKCKYTSSNFIVLIVGIWAIVSFAVSIIYMKQILTPWEILLSMGAIWAIDTGAYFTGKRLGKNKLSSHVSPGKTWEGLFGGGFTALFVLIIGVLLLSFNFNVYSIIFILLATFISLTSVYGDLFQSLLKRQVNLKDSGKILPGHGGILDRLDSLIIALPLFCLLWLWYPK